MNTDFLGWLTRIRFWLIEIVLSDYNIGKASLLIFKVKLCFCITEITFLSELEYFG